ncbi:MAG: histidine triad nucleotide-binding protein [Oscillospiraceae bacterium]|nr:histidine triad nucleotide-binding protein [Oscillospiraceae bacterium]
MNNCLFCKIINNEIPSEKVYSDEEIIAFKDINPQAPVHILVIPKKHIDGADVLEKEDAALAGRLLLTAARIAEQFHLSNGYRIVTNIGEHGGQTVRHLHFHLIGGEKLIDSF